ncbi:hypothetical protein D3C79_917570 [compost metagenome]
MTIGVSGTDRLILLQQEVSALDATEVDVRINKPVPIMRLILIDMAIPGEPGRAGLECMARRVAQLLQKRLGRAGEYVRYRTAGHLAACIMIE